MRTGFEERMDRAAALVRERPHATGWDVAAALTGPAWDRMGPMGRRFTTIEAMGLLHALVRQGRLASSAGSPERFLFI